MRKFTFTALAMLFFALNATAQTQQSQLPPNSFIAAYSDITVTPQESYTPSFKIDGSKARIKNVILLIGDGMGLGAVASAMYANGGKLTMMNLQTLGYVLTQSADNFITDSAASGTAYSTGQKTNNGYVGMTPDGVHLTNLPEAITPYGYVCGVVTTDGIEGATPASFYAHQNSRGNYEAIWEDLASSHLSFFAGGSKGNWDKLPMHIQRKIQSEYSMIFAPDEKEVIKSSSKLGYLPVNVVDGRGDYLPEATQIAIDYLSARSKKGFFLMVEGSHIDYKAHTNKATLVEEVLDFDKAVEVALRFAEKDGHTLVIISADHETGGVIIRKGDVEENEMQLSFSTRGHSPMPVSLFAYGPGSFAFRGAQQNSDVGNKIRKILIGK